MDRIIGEYTGQRKGPLLVVFGAMHGNEPAGVNALRLMFEMLESEPNANPDFSFSGRLLGLVGNHRAFAARKRFLNKDLNRQWLPETVARIRELPAAARSEEEQEIQEVLAILHHQIETYQPDRMIVLDIHTTTAHGGIFSIATDDPESLRIAIELHAPVIMGMLKGISGTSLHYFCSDNFPVPTTAVCFEAGQHNEPLSTNRAIAAITNCMRTIGCVRAEDVENRHDRLLIEYSKGLPKVSELLNVYAINNGERFEMCPGYKNFQPVRRGEVLAKNERGNITAADDGRILMPLYQSQGEDGFFLIRDLDY